MSGSAKFKLTVVLVLGVALTALLEAAYGVYLLLSKLMGF